MIRSIKERASLAGEGPEKLLIKRRFVPMELTVSENGQYHTFREKVPYHIHRVVGIVITHDAPTHRMHHNRTYVGSSTNKPITPQFIGSLPHDLIGSEAVRYQLDVGRGQKLYFAHPKRLGSSELILDGRRYQFQDPVTITLRDFWTDLKEDYWVWESKKTGWGKVTLSVEPNTDTDDK